MNKIEKPSTSHKWKRRKPSHWKVDIKNQSTFCTVKGSCHLTSIRKDWNWTSWVISCFGHVSYVLVWDPLLLLLLGSTLTQLQRQHYLCLKINQMHAYLATPLFLLFFHDLACYSNPMLVRFKHAHDLNDLAKR